MTADQKRLLRETFALLEGHASVAPLLFYHRLFTLKPSLRGLFTTDIEAQGRKLMEALAFIVATFDSPQVQGQALAALGRRHAAYGVRTEDYATVGRALIWMMEEDLGPVFTAEAREAWELAYDQIARRMQGVSEVQTDHPVFPPLTLGKAH